MSYKQQGPRNSDALAAVAAICASATAERIAIYEIDEIERAFPTSECSAEPRPLIRGAAVMLPLKFQLRIKISTPKPPHQ